MEQTRTPLLTVAFDPRTYGVTIGGSIPSWEFAEAILYMALKEAERKCNERRVQKRIALAGPELLTNLKGPGA